MNGARDSPLATRISKSENVHGSLNRRTEDYIAVRAAKCARTVWRILYGYGHDSQVIHCEFEVATRLCYISSQ